MDVLNKLREELDNIQLQGAAYDESHIVVFTIPELLILLDNLERKWFGDGQSG